MWTFVSSSKAPLTLDDCCDLGLKRRRYQLVLGPARIHRIVVLLPRHELVGVLGAVGHGGVARVYPQPVLVPGHGGERVAAAGDADQRHGLPRLQSLLVFVSLDLRRARGICSRETRENKQICQFAESLQHS